MLNRTLILGIAAMVAIAVGLAMSFFELIVLGVIAATVTVVLTLKRSPTHETPGR